MTPATIISIGSHIALFLLSVAFLMTVVRTVRGPTLPDRIIGLDLLVAIAIGFIAVVSIKTGFAGYIDIAISLGLVGFLSTVAFARFVLVHGSRERLSEEKADAASAGVGGGDDAG